MYTYKQNITPEIESLKYLYTENVSEKSNEDFVALHQAVQTSDYCLTAWDKDKLIGMIRSSGDSDYIQLISDFIVHEDYQSRGVSSELINTYLTLTKEVREFLLVSKYRFQSTYMITWLEHKGFHLKTEETDFYIFHKKQ